MRGPETGGPRAAGCAGSTSRPLPKIILFPSTYHQTNVQDIALRGASVARVENVKDGQHFVLAEASYSRKRSTVSETSTAITCPIFFTAIVPAHAVSGKLKRLPAIRAATDVKWDNAEARRRANSCNTYRPTFI